MAKSLDFFTMDQGSHPLPKPPIFERRRSFRDIQRFISKMNPEIVKSVIANGSFSANKSAASASVPNLGNQTNFSPSPSPLCDYTLRLGCGYEKNGANTAPLTIFYNGTVAVFDVSPQKAQNILEIAEQTIPRSSAEYSEINSRDKKDRHLPESLNDLPITRRISLQRFLEKRRERLITLSPYYFPTNYSTSTSKC